MKKIFFRIILAVLILVLLYASAWLCFYQFVCKPHISDDLTNMSESESTPFTVWYTDYQAPPDEMKNQFFLTVSKFGLWKLTIGGMSSVSVDTKAPPITLPDGTTTYPSYSNSGTPYNLGIFIDYNIFGKIKKIKCRVSKSGDNNHSFFEVNESLDLIQKDTLTEEQIALYNDAKEYLPYYFETTKSKFGFQ